MVNNLKRGGQCILCKNEDCEKISAKIRDLDSSDIQIYQCKNCGVQFLYPQRSEEELKKYYDGNYRKIYVDENYYNEQYISEYFKKQLPEAERRVNRFKNELSEEDSILEVGCSSGYFLSTIKPYVKEACGTEWDNKNSEYVRNMGFEVKQNIEEYIDKKFDKIFMFHVLEHIKKPIKFLAFIKEYLKPKGKLYIEVPNNQDVLLSVFELQEFKDFYYQLAHLYYFNPKSLEYVLTKSEYKNIEIKFIQRYDISNHLQWLKDRKPGGMGAYNHIFSKQLNEVYSKELKNTERTDTIMAVCSF